MTAIRYYNKYLVDFCLKLLVMKAITHEDWVSNTYAGQSTHLTTENLWRRFVRFADKQECNRLGWLVAGILGHGTIFTILTLLAVTVLGNIFLLYIIACCSMVIVVSANLAAMPTRYTIPILFISLLIDLGVIITAIFLHFSSL